MKYPQPYFIYFPSAGSADIGFISIAELSRLLPFSVERVFWTYDTPGRVIRGRHAHRTTEQVLIALSGKITVTSENFRGDISTFTLSNPSVGVYLPPNVWHTMRYSKNAVQLVMASSVYSESDYFRDKADFIEYWSKQDESAL